MPPLAIAEFYPCAVGGDEYLVIQNRGAEAVNLLGWTVTDGEGAVTFLGGTMEPGESLSMSENATSFESAYGFSPTLALPAWTSTEDARVSGSFRLADSGDSIELRSPDESLADVVAYGSCALPADGWYGEPIPSLRDGEVVRRNPGDEDTDTSADWMHFREYRYGYSSHPVLSCTVPAGGLRCYVSPDCSLDVILDIISASSSDVRVCSYELSSSPVCAALIDAVSRGVGVRVLVDSQPVGGMSVEQIACMSCLDAAGADVRVLGGNMADGELRHVGALHAKYVVADGATLAVLSENLVEAGVPTDRLFGNRGWGVALDAEPLASFMEGVFDDDSRLDRSDIWLWREDSRFDPGSSLPDSSDSAHPRGMLDQMISSEDAGVTLYLSPDASPVAPFLADVLSEARDVRFEQFQAEVEWDCRWVEAPVANPIIGAVAGVLRAGGVARGLFDGLWYNAGCNGEASDYLSSVAQSCGLPASFGLLAEENPVTVLHNKGLVLDGRAFVSSNNWVYSSFARNRELAVLVDGGGAAGYFSSAFELDWVPDTNPPVADAGLDVTLDSPCEVVFDASMSYDDRAIANFSWDVDGDGSPDAWGAQPRVLLAYTGTYRVSLTVTDAWGNAATDALVLTVGGNQAPSASEPPLTVAVPWPLPAALSVLAVALAVARKLNLLGLFSLKKG